jgi:transposase
MLKKKMRIFSRDVKLAAVCRMLAGENVTGLARELKLRRKLLYEWRDNYRAGGPDALRQPGRPRKAAAVAAAEAARSKQSAGAASDGLAAARRRIADLERMVGQQQLALDFFRQALRRVSGKRRPSDGPGAATSTRSSKR